MISSLFCLGSDYFILKKGKLAGTLQLENSTDVLAVVVVATVITISEALFLRPSGITLVKIGV